MSKLFRVIGTHAGCPEGEALMADARSRRALRLDPEGALLTFELRRAESAMRPVSAKSGSCDVMSAFGAPVGTALG